jgi:putative ABC transport system permease protein
MATTLLVGAGLLMQSFVKLVNIDTGFGTANVLNFQLVLPRQYAPAQKLALAEDLAGRLRLLPQVLAVGFTNDPPLTQTSLGGSLIPSSITPAEQRRLMQTSRRPFPQIRSVSSGYLAAMGVRLVDGRWFETADGEAAPPVVLFNRAFVRRWFGARSPLGEPIGFGPLASPIVGVVDDVRMYSLERNRNKPCTDIRGRYWSVLNLERPPRRAR